MVGTWISYLRALLGMGVAGTAVVSTAGGATASVPDAIATATDGPIHAPLVFERPNYNEGQLFAGHSSHSSHASHASHASHSSHYSGSGGGGDYTPYVPPAPPSPPPSFSEPPPQPAPPPRATTYLVMIMRVQSKLHELGYYTGTIDGVFGSGTKDALRRFQLVKQLPATGRMDDATLAALGITY